MRLARFREIVEEVVEHLPARFREPLAEVRIVVQEAPTAEWLAAHELEEETDLLGFYDGVPLTEAGDAGFAPFRGTITVFRDPHLAMTTDRHALREEIERTVIHEIAHHFGLDEDDVDRLGYA